MKTTEKYARKCSVTGKGMNEGWYIDGEYFSTKELADKKAQEILKDPTDKTSAYKNFKDLHQDCEADEDHDFAYWTDWSETLEEEDEWYDKDGQLHKNCFNCGEETPMYDDFNFCTNCLSHL